MSPMETESENAQLGATLLTAICSQCGYDLRGIASDRCPECGFELALQPALFGEIAWTYRKPRGRVRAFLQTVHRVTAGGPWIGRVIATPISLGDARRFWLVAATIAALPLMIFAAWAAIFFRDKPFLVFLPDPYGVDTPAMAQLFSLTPPKFGFPPVWVTRDLVWPLSAGLTRPGMPVVAVWLFVLLGSGAPTYLFHPKRLGEAHRQRANAFSYYLVAPLVYAAVPVSGLMVVIGRMVTNDVDLFSKTTFVGALFAIALTVVLALWWARAIKTLRATTLCAMPGMVAAAILLPLMWLVCATFALVFVPWCVGVAWLLIDALRG